MKPTLSELYEYFPYVGLFKEWDSGRGFGFIKYNNKNIFAHISCRYGSQKDSRDQQIDLENKKCLFAIGVTPHDYVNRKNRTSAISWIIEDDIEGSIDGYEEFRTESIKIWNHDQLQKILKADWYIKKWEKVSDDFPKAKLPIDNILLTRIKEFENNNNNFSEFISWLKIKQKSPYFVVSEEDRQQIWKDGISELDKKPPQFFQECSPKEFIDKFEKYQFSNSLLQNILPHLFCFHKLNSIDLESNGDTIFQIGLAKGNELYFSGDLNNSTNIISEIKKVEDKIGKNWIVGHNILGWDIPILRKKQSNCFNDLPLWDTMLVSWILEPWKKSYALTSSECSHRADADAKAALELCKEQLEQMPIEFILSLVDNLPNSIELIFQIGKIISNIKNRNYPNPPQYLIDLKNDIQNEKLVFISESRLFQCMWSPGVLYKWPQMHTDKQDFVLSPEKVIESANMNPDNPWLRAVAIVIQDAYENGVQVLLRMLPFWLREKTEDILQGCGGNILPKSTDNILNITTYAAWKNASSSEKIDVFSNAKNILLFPHEGDFEILPEPKPIRFSEIEKSIKTLANPEAYLLLQINNKKIIEPLIAKSLISDNDYWLEFNPASKKDADAQPWQLLLKPKAVFPSIFKQEDIPYSQIDAKKISAYFPRWRPAGAPTGIFSQDFVPPSSGNRFAYWQDTITRFLSLECSSHDQCVFVLLTFSRYEQQAANNALAAIKKTYLIHDSVLRRLEALHKNNQRFVVDHISNAYLWLQASEQLAIPVQLVIETLPLTQWWICLSEEFQTFLTDIEPEKPEEDEDNSIKDHTDQEIPSEEVKNVIEQSEEIVQYANKENFSPVLFSRDSITHGIERFIGSWLSIVCKGISLQIPPIILDSRFDNINFGKNPIVSRRDVFFQPLSQNDRNIVIDSLRADLGELEIQDPPTDYESYQDFLKKYWGDDFNFKQDTQKPAIEAIIPNDSDVLVRLPTGEGKSVLFQIPALLRGFKTQRLSIVITPLRALMTDQVTSLWMKGFIQSADYLSSDRDQWTIDEVFQGIIDNRIKLLFVAPERFRSPRFREAIQRRYENDKGFEYMVIDEAHCISQWGFQFRPDYLYAMSLIKDLYRNPEKGTFTHILLFSATVTEAIRKDIEQEAGIQENIPYKIKPEEMKHPIQSFIRLFAQDVPKSTPQNIAQIRKTPIEEVIKKANIKESAIIIFVRRRQEAEDLSNVLHETLETGGINNQMIIRYFHAGLPALERLEVYEDLKAKQIHVLICTKAFGMGMDIPHLHWCIHLSPPSFLEDYLQEVGRTGRGEKARSKAGLDFVECTLLFNPEDFEWNHSKIQEGRITPPMLDDVWSEILKISAQLAHMGMNICIIPTDNFAQLKKDKLRLALFWLERSKRLQIYGYLPGLLRIRFKKNALESMTQGTNEAAIVAHAILKIYQMPPIQSSRRQTRAI